jgi:magnesium transporter
MARFFRDRIGSKGLAPGSVVFIGDKKVEHTKINVIDYSKDKVNESVIKDINDLKDINALPGICWVNVYGLHDSAKMTQIGEIFSISSMFLEDIVNTDQRPKLDEGEITLGFILKTIDYDPKLKKVRADQISLILGKDYVLTLQEHSVKIFEPVRERIRNNKGRLRVSGADYLAYALLDNIIDNYLFVIGTMGEQIEDLCRLIITKPGNSVSSQVYNFKIELNYLRKIIRPVREMLLQWHKTENNLVDKKTWEYLRDLSDLATQAEESIEIYSNILSDTLTIYNTNISNKSNEIIRVLTIFTAVFIPLTFLVGVYGMNFKYMPEIEFKYSYPIFWTVTLSIVLGLLLYFKRKKWL